MTGLAKAIGGFSSNDFTSFYRQRVSIVLQHAHQFVNMMGLAKPLVVFSLMILQAFIDKGCQ
jgi:hypothetical protein